MILEGKTCLITGASRGLGKEIALKFWEAGANILLVARSLEKMEHVVDSFSERPEQFCKLLPFDLSEDSAPSKVIAQAKREVKSLDVLVNNAAIIGPIGPLWENSWEAWKETMQVNFFAPIDLCRLCIPWMGEKGGGKIINLSGGGATGPRENFSAYASAKTALVRCSETLALEVTGLSIDVNCIAPGVMKTEMLLDVVKAGAKVAGEREFAIASRSEEGEENQCVRPAELALYLASSASDGVTGKLISAVWDPWKAFHERMADLRGSDIYTLRRIVPKDRCMAWGDV